MKTIKLPTLCLRFKIKNQKLKPCSKSLHQRVTCFELRRISHYDDVTSQLEVEHSEMMEKLEEAVMLTPVSLFDPFQDSQRKSTSHSRVPGRGNRAKVYIIWL